MADAAIIIVTHNSARFIGDCLSSLQSTEAHICVVDNGSTDDTRQIVRQYHHVRLLEASANMGYGEALNLGAAQTDYKYLILSNADVVYREDTVAKLVSFLKSDPEIGITAPQQISPSGGWQLSYGDTPGIWLGFKDAVGIGSALRWYRRLRWPKRVDRRPKQVGYLAGAVLALPREAFSHVHGFDENFHFYGEETDLCLRLRSAGWKVVFYPAAEVIHHGGGHSMKVDQSDKFYRLLTQSQVMLAKKHLPSWRARFYMWMEKLCFQRLALTLRLIRILSRARKNGQFAQRIWAMDVCTKLWAEQLARFSANDPETETLSIC